MEMPQKVKFKTIDFKPPQSLKEALQRFSLELECLMIWMRNEAHYHDNFDHAVLDAAYLVSQALEDSHKEATRLIPQIERRVTGADLS